MRYTLAFATAALFSHASASPTHMEARQNGGSGTGSFGPGTYKTDSSLRDKTIYYPTKAGSEKLPVLIWGEGACSNAGRSNQALLQQIASYGFFAIAEGGPNGSGTSNSATMKASIDWVSQKAGTGDYANVDASKIMVAGFSCGGTEAMDNIWDARVDSVGVISSGLLSNQSAAANWRKPVLFVLGGSSDIAYQNGERDFKNMASGVPTWKGNINVGHGGTLTDANGGRFGKVILNWLLYQFKGQEAGLTYLKSGYSADGFQVQTKSFDLFKPIA